MSVGACLNIAVVVPVYNVKPYLEQCVNSILGQSYPVHEVLLVDDGSTDGSGEICDQLAIRYACVRVIHKQNAGLGFARNTGIENISAENSHVMFCDSDDWFEPDMVEALARAIEDSGADCAIGGFTKRDDSGSSQFELRLDNFVWEGEDLIRGLVPRVCGSAPGVSDSVPMSVCSSIFAKKNIDEYNLRFLSERDVLSEDFIFKFQYLKTCKSVATSSCVGYSYRTNMGSLTTSYRSDRFEASLHFYDFSSRLVEGLPSEEDCKRRLQKTLFVNIKMCICQEAACANGKTRRDAITAIRKMTGDERLLKIIEEYPCDELGLTQRGFVMLLRRRAALLLYAAAASGIM